MPQSLSAIYLHLVWSTKDRFPFIIPEVEQQLQAYLGEICHRLDCPPVKIGGWIDHVHVLCMMSRTIPVMKLLEDLKSHSSKWIKTIHPDCRHFYWQTGYAAFSVGVQDVPILKDYIRNQHQHHASQSFQDELRGLLLDHGQTWDERYIWD